MRIPRIPQTICCKSRLYIRLIIGLMVVCIFIFGPFADEWKILANPFRKESIRQGTTTRTSQRPSDDTPVKSNHSTGISLPKTFKPAATFEDSSITAIHDLTTSVTEDKIRVPLELAAKFAELNSATKIASGGSTLNSTMETGSNVTFLNITQLTTNTISVKPKESAEAAERMDSVRTKVLLKTATDIDAVKANDSAEKATKTNSVEAKEPIVSVKAKVLAGTATSPQLVSSSNGTTAKPSENSVQNFSAPLQNDTNPYQMVHSESHQTTPVVVTLKKTKKKKKFTVWVPPVKRDIKVNAAYESSLTYILNNEKRCMGDFAKNPSLLIFVESAVGDFKRRRVWRSKLPFFQTSGDRRVTFLFILALPKDMEKVTQARVVNESHAYGDILQLNYTDTYKTLVLKTVAGLKWVMKYCAQAQFILKTDVDCFVNVHSILEFLNKLKAEKKEYLYGGYTQSRAGAMRSGKWGITKEEYPYDVYPPYTLGFGILMAKKSLERFAKSSAYVKYFAFEDVYVGMLAKASNVNITWVQGFLPYGGRGIDKKLDYCNLKVHKVLHDFRSPKLFGFFWNIFRQFAAFNYKC